MLFYLADAFCAGGFSMGFCPPLLVEREREAAVDDAVVALAGFALSLTKVNPGFFKIIGQSSGSNAKVESFPRGTNVVLYNRGGDYSDITIRDSVEAGAIQIKFTVLKQGEPYSVQISARNNGNIQGTLEIEKFDQIN